LCGLYRHWHTDGRREILGVSVSLSEAETHWRGFLKSLKKRGLSGVKFVASDDHDGLKAALNAEFTGVIWQRCQCHLQRNAVKHVPKVSMRNQVAEDLRDIFNAKNLICAEERLQKCVEKYSKSAPQLAEWIEENIPEGLAVFTLPGKHRKRMRTTNMLERSLHEILQIISILLFEKTPLKQALTGNLYIFKKQQNYNQLSLFDL